MQSGQRRRAAPSGVPACGMASNDSRGTAGATGSVGSAGYSGTPLHRKLGIKAGMRVLVTRVPKGWDLSVLDPERTASVTTRPATRAGSPPYDVVVAFCPDQAAVRATLANRLDRVSERGRLWVCWPKKASGVPSDLDDNVVRELGLASGIVDVKVCAVDAIWSGMCFMTRLRDRAS